MKLPPKRTRNQISKLVAALNYDFRNYELHHFIEFLNAHRKRPILLRLYPTHLNLGLWVPGAKIEYILIPQNAHIHPVHQEHIALHEIAHILLEHPTKPVDQLSETPLAGLEDVPHGVLNGALARMRDNLLDEPIEVEAEYMATLIKKRSINARHRYTWNGQLSSISGMDAIAENLQFFDGKSER
jgi:hypothetical protein